MKVKPGDVLYSQGSRGGDYPVVIFADEPIPVDYWAAVRSDLVRLHDFEQFDLATFDQDIWSSLNEVVGYIETVHRTHSLALETIDQYVNENKQFVLYLRNVKFSGAGKSILSESGLSESGKSLPRLTADSPEGAGKSNLSESGKWERYRIQPRRGGDFTMLPMLQEYFGATPVLCLNCIDMFCVPHYSAFNNIHAFRAHRYNWTTVVEKLVRAAAMIIVCGDKYVRGMELECGLIQAHRRQNHTVIAVRSEMTSIETYKFDEIGATINLYDFVADASEEGTCRTKISQAGKELLQSVFQRAVDTKVDLRELLVEKCTVVGKDFHSLPYGIDPSARGFFLPESKFPFVLKLDNLKQSLIAAHETLNQDQVAKILSPDQLRLRASQIVAHAVRTFACACELEQYEPMCYALNIMAIRLFTAGYSLPFAFEIAERGLSLGHLEGSDPHYEGLQEIQQVIIRACELDIRSSEATSGGGLTIRSVPMGQEFK